MFQSYQLAYQLSQGSKAHNQGVEGKDEVEMQTPVDDSGIFTEVSRSAQAFP